MALSDILREIRESGPIGLAAVGRQFGIEPTTVWRWSKRGILSPNGRRVHLDVARVGMKLVTSQAAVDRFLAAINEQPAACATPVARPTANNAAAALEAAGW